MDEQKRPNMTTPTEKDNPGNPSTPQWMLDVEKRLKEEFGDRAKFSTLPPDYLEVLFFENPKVNPYKKREEKI